MNALRLYTPEGLREIAMPGTSFLVGSAADCDLVLTGQGKNIPALALEWVKTGESWEVQALAPCSLNGQALQGKAKPRPGDRFEIGGAVLVFDQVSGNTAVTQAKTGSLSPAEAPGFALAESLQEFARLAAAEADVGKLLQALLDSAKKTLQATEAFVFTLNGEGKPEAVAGLSEGEAMERFSDSVVQSVLTEGKGLVLADAAKDQRFSGARSIAEWKLHSVLCVPVLLGGKVTGCVYLGSRRLQVAYGPADLKALQAFAQVLGLLVHHVEFMAKQAATLRDLTGVTAEAGLLAQSPAMLKVLREADAVAAADISILIQGETGTGKELLAERLHRRSGRGKGPFIAVNCSSLRGELLESELFGYKRGAFTGAMQDRGGLFAAARAGTLFLDEIGEMDLALQSKILRALETGKIRPVGATAEESVDVRVICATHRDLKTMVAEKTFREDLYYRLAPIPLLLPPLRERRGDAALLAQAFLARFKARYPAKDLRGFHPQSLRAMAAYAWPGNVRELLNAVHKAVLLSPGPLVEMDLGTGSSPQGEPEFLGFDEATLQFQRQYLEQALALVDGNREQAAKILKMSRSTFFRYLSQIQADSAGNSPEGNGLK